MFGHKAPVLTLCQGGAIFQQVSRKKTTGLTMTEVGGMGAALANEETITF